MTTMASYGISWVAAGNNTNFIANDLYGSIRTHINGINNTVCFLPFLFSSQVISKSFQMMAGPLTIPPLQLYPTFRDSVNMEM